MDGELVSGLVYDVDGVHELIVSDAYGNECVYTLIVVRDVPTLEYALGEGGKNTVTFDREYRLKDVVTVSIYDEFDEMAMFYVYDDEDNLLSILNRDETYLLNESGKYVVQAVNHTGKSQEFILYLSLDDPKIEGAENAEDKTFEIDVTDSADKYAGFLPESFRASIVETCERSISAVLSDNAVVLADAIVQKVLAPLLTPVISVVLFFVAFALLRMLVSMLVTVLGLVNRLPVIGTVNRWLGWVTGCVASTMDIYLMLCVVWAVIVITGGNLTVLNDTVMSSSLYYKAFNLFNPFL